MTTPTPSPENGYTVDATMDMTAQLFNGIFGSVHERLAAREALEANFEALIAQGTSAALALVQVNVAPQLAALQQQITDAAAAVEEIIDNGAAPNSLKLAGELPAYYLDPANFSTAGFIRTLLASADEEAARTTLGVRSQAESDAAIAAAVDAAITALLDGTPGALDTLNELAAALGDDPNFATTVAASIATKVAKAGEALAGGFRALRHPYGTLTTGSINLSFANGNGGKVDLGAGGGSIVAPAAVANEIATMVVDIIGLAGASGTKIFVGFDAIDGDPMPGANQKGVLSIIRTPEACFGVIKRKP